MKQNPQNLSSLDVPTNEDGTMKLNPGDDTSAKHPLIDSYYTDKRNVINNLNANIYAKVSLPFNISYQMNFSPRYEHHVVQIAHLIPQSETYLFWHPDLNES